MADEKDLSLFERFLPKKLRTAGKAVGKGIDATTKAAKRGSARVGGAVSPGVKRGGTKSGGGSRFYKRGKDGTVRSVSERTLAKRGAAAGAVGAAGVGTGVALSGSGKKKADKKEKPKVNYNVGVSRGGVPFAEAFKHFRGQGQKTFSWNGKKYTTELKKKGKAAAKKPKKVRGLRKFLLGEDGKFGGKRGAIDFLPGKSRPGRKAKDDKKASGKAGGGMMSKKGYAKGGMSKKGYAKGGMTKKGYAKGGSVRGKPRGVGAAVRGYGKALT